MTTPELTHGCARCGAQVPLDVGLCERCNPIGLRDVSSSQVHGMAIAGAIAGIVLLAIAGRFFLAGVGPFEATIAQAVPQGDGLAVTLAVTNSGNATGQTTCHLTDPADRSSGMGAFMLTPRIDPGATLMFTEKVTALGSSVRPLDVDCTSP